MSSLYEYLIISGCLQDSENPIQMVDDAHGAYVSRGHRPPLGCASRQRPIRKALCHREVRRCVTRVQAKGLDRCDARMPYGTANRADDRGMLY